MSDTSENTDDDPSTGPQDSMRERARSSHGAPPTKVAAVQPSDAAYAPIPGSKTGSRRRPTRPSRSDDSEFNLALAHMLMTIVERLETQVQAQEVRIRELEREDRRGRRIRSKMRRDISDLQQSRDDEHDVTQRQIADVRAIMRALDEKVEGFDWTLDYVRKYLDRELDQGKPD